ncbi:MAG TPA: maleylpyruvate isomerase family mycothiol-dependent enzyme [Acidimicrobiales bacterium]|nr:maleylpyruvate isomerase family mycothiol-dependent enzyme [Acidimicrobiales bacterium]
MDSPESDALAAQVHELVELVDSLADADHTRPSRCPGWAVAELVAHCEGMLVRLVGANAEPYPGPPAIDRVGYYRYDPDGPREGEDPSVTFSEVIRDRVIDEVAGRGPAELRHALRNAAHAALTGIELVPADRVIKRSGHPSMTFGEFVASRNLEFGVHTLDIAHACGRPEKVNAASAKITVEILDGLLGAPVPDAVGWSAVEYILAGTGRIPLTTEDRRRLGASAEKFPLLR